MLYPNNTIIDKLPGTLEDFTLEWYKELGKPYSKISLFICRKECLEKIDLESDCDSIGEAVLQRSYVANNVSIDKGITRPRNKHKTSTLEAKTTCPLCYLDFPTSEIEYHADLCSQELDFVGIVENPSETIDDVDPDVDDADNSIWIGKIKDVISCANKMVDMKPVNRVSIRRRFVFKDYITARGKLKQRNRFDPKGLLKITFIGEPVDNGGPRREFLSGRVTLFIQEFTKFNFVYLFKNFQVLNFLTMNFIPCRSTR